MIVYDTEIRIYYTCISSVSPPFLSLNNRILGRLGKAILLVTAHEPTVLNLGAVDKINDIVPEVGGMGGFGST